MRVAESVTSAPTNERDPHLSERTLALVTAAATLPILWLGYGTDLDVAAVLRTGELIREGSYQPSRSPGVPVFEAIVAVLDPIGGHLAINLATAMALLAAVIGCARLVRSYGRPNGELVALVLLACPITLITGTSTTDFIWALALFIWGALTHRRGHPAAAGVLFALSIGARGSTGLLVLAFLVAEGWPPPERRRCLTTAAVTVPLGLLLYVPAWLSYDRTLGFVDRTNGWQGLANNVGRFVYKNYALGGVLAAALLLTAVPPLVRSLRRWRTDPLVRFGFLGLVAVEGLFLMIPWKLAHLLPAVLVTLLWLAATEWNRPARLWLLAGALAINGVVAFRPLLPDEPDASRSAAFEPALTVGHLLNDVRCRARTMDEPPRIDSEAWPCALEPLRGPSNPPPPSG